MAHDEPTVAVEAAASLFDSKDDAGSVFFSSTSFSDERKTAATEETSAAHHVSSDTSNLFEAGPEGDASALFGNSSYDDTFPSTNDAGQWPMEQSQSEETASHSTYAANDESSASTTQEYDYSQWQQYDSANSYASTYDYTPDPPNNTYASQGNSYSQPTYDSTQQTSDYNAYTPAATYGVSSQNAYTPQQTYDPQKYAPPAVSKPVYQQDSYQASYAPPLTSTSVYGQSAPSSYAPANQAYTPAYSVSTPTSTYNTAYSSTISNVNSIPTPRPPVQPPKDVSAYRSNTRNAYDPPIPTKSRIKSRNVSYASTAIPNAYQQYQDPVKPPPLPPPPASTLTSTPAHSNYTNVQQYTSHSTSYATTGQQFDPTKSAPPPKQVNTSSYSRETIGISGSTINHTYLPNTEVSQGGLSFKQSSVEASFVDPEGGDFFNDTLKGGQLASNEFATASASEPIADGEKTAIPATFGAVSASPPPPAPSPSNSVKSVGSSYKQAPYDPYSPANRTHQTSTSQTLPQQRPSSTTPWDPYAPTAKSKRSHRSSQSSVYSNHSVSTGMNDSHSSTPTVYDPYPSKSVPQRSASRQSYGLYEGGHAGQAPVVVPEPNGSAYTVITTAYSQGPYAPSPSLLGTNDPLGRTSVKVPVISFGFGGKFVGCFHSTGETSTGFDVSLTSRQSTTVSIRTLHDVIPASAMDSATNYPGPLYSDPGPSTLSLARTVGVGTTGNIKAKKAAVSKWLEEQGEELAKSIAHIPVGSQERYNAEGRLALISLLKVMIDHDGQLSGSPEIEWAVRKALIYRLQDESSAEGGIKDLPLAGYGSTFADLNEQPLAVCTLKASSLDRIREFLIRGQRREAFHYAMDEKLWAHAMVIASSVNAQSWQEVVKEFIRSELGTKPSLLSLAEAKADNAAPTSNGRESLRVAYSLFGGHGASSVQELVPPKPISIGKEASMTVPPGPGMHTTPISPNFPQPVLTSSVSPETLAKWQETAAMMAFSGTPGDSAALTALGDYLAANRWIEAAHVCYLLSPRTSAFGGAGLPSVRMVLVGSDTPASHRGFFRDLDVTILSEIVEFALSLSTLKGQDGFTGLPHLQAYKLLRASHLAEMGYVELSNRYCEAIGTSIRSSNRGSQFYTPTFIGELKNLSDRLTAAPQADKTASWIAKKMTKPSLDTLGSWLEGSFSRLIVGEGEENGEAHTNDSSQAPKTAYGPFSHYSTISSIAPSAAPSRTSTPYLAPAASATSSGPSIPARYPHGPVDRAASAMDHLRPERDRASPVQRVASASAATTTFSQAYAMSQSDDADGQDVAWWSSNNQDRSGPTPTAATFHTSDDNESAGNFVSLMDNVNVGPTASSSHPRSYNVQEDDDEEDLGFGNSSTKKNKEAAAGTEEKVDKIAEEKLKEEPKKEEPKQQGGSWLSLSRWWGRGNSTPAPIKANLGEETSFYYDKELKRWVNKKAGAAAATPPPPPPPPSRPRTAGPSTEPTKGTGGPTGSTPPPPRASSAAELPGPPRKPRVRSNLVPQEEYEALPLDDPPSAPGSAPPTATRFDTLHPMSDGPPMGRPKSAAAKRNVRSRYVDVFQQQQ